MSWDESELRAALHEGEGQALSPGHLVALGEARRQRRHDRLRTAAVAVVVTGLLGGGVGALTQLGGSSESGSSNTAGGAALGRDSGAKAGAGSAPRAPRPDPVAGGPATAAHGAAGSEIARPLTCPARAAAVPLPAPDAADTTAPLFAEPVASITVCGYRARQSGRTFALRGSTTLVGSAARKLTTGLGQASRTPMTRSCPGPGGPSTLLTIRARSAVGGPLPTVTVDGGSCGSTITNGTAVRYGWTPPANLAALTR